MIPWYSTQWTPLTYPNWHFSWQHKPTNIPLGLTRVVSDHVATRIVIYVFTFITVCITGRHLICSHVIHTSGIKFRHAIIRLSRGLQYILDLVVSLQSSTSRVCCCFFSLSWTTHHCLSPLYLLAWRCFPNTRLLFPIWCCRHLSI